MKVEVIEGPDAGSSMAIQGGRMIIGRSESCDLQLTDAAASRRHVEIIVGSAGVILRDLGSGNGTRVNGKRVTETTLAHGDELELGQTRLTFVDEVEALRSKQAARQLPAAHGEDDEEEVASDEAFDQVPDSADDYPVRTGTAKLSAESIPAQTRKRILVIGGSVLGAIVVLILLLAPRRPPPNAHLTPMAEAKPLFEQAKRYIEERDFAKAGEKIHEAHRIAPDDPQISEYLEATDAAVDADKKLKKIRALVAAGEYDAARGILRTIPEKALLFFDDQLLQKTTAEIDEKQSQSLHEQIDALLAKGQFEQARPLIAKLPAKEQAGVQLQIDEAAKRLRADERAEEERNRKEQANKRSVRARRAHEEVDKVLAAAVKKIDSEEFDRAQGELERVASQSRNAAAAKKAKEVLRKLPELGSSYKEGMRRFEEGEAANAAKPLQKALYLYEKLDLDGNLDEQIKPKLAQALYMRGKGEQVAGDYASAAKDFQNALKVEPGHAGSKAAVRELSEEANKVFMEGYYSMNTDQDLARKKFREVMLLAQPKSEAYEKAKKWLIKLGDTSVE
jgi:hypothetical protein